MTRRAFVEARAARYDAGLCQHAARSERLRRASLRRLGLCAVIMLSACHKPMLWLGSRLDAAESDVAGSAAPSERDAGPNTPTVTSRQATPSAGAPQPNAGGEPSAGTGGEPRDSTRTALTHPQATTGLGGATASAGRGALTAAGGAGEPKTEDVDAGPGEPAAPAPTRLPTAKAACPSLKATGTYTFGSPSRSLSVKIYIAADARSKPAPGGPLILYWHGFGDDATEVETGLGAAAIDDVVAHGGIVAAFNSRWCASCGLADDVAWYKEDDAVSDHVIACALDQARIDTRRIHAVGFSAGAMHSLHLALARSSFIASVVSYSGGAADLLPSDAQDPSNRVPTLLSFGSAELDTVGLNFNMTSLQWYETYHALGWYLLLCPHGGGHAIPNELAPHVYRFLLDHPYKVDPEPYAKQIPAEFPRYCRNQP